VTAGTFHAEHRDETVDQGSRADSHVNSHDHEKQFGGGRNGDPEDNNDWICQSSTTVRQCTSWGSLISTGMANLDGGRCWIERCSSALDRS
jgi:hypothetical protein